MPQIEVGKVVLVDRYYWKNRTGDCREEPGVFTEREKEMFIRMRAKKCGGVFLSTGSVGCERK